MTRRTQRTTRTDTLLPYTTRIRSQRHEDDPDGGQRHVYFRPGAVFARVERATPERRQLSVLRAAGPGERVLRIAGLAPGAQLLLHATTNAQTELALQALAAIQAPRLPLDEVNANVWTTGRESFRGRVCLVV